MSLCKVFFVYRVVTESQHDDRKLIMLSNCREFPNRTAAEEYVEEKSAQTYEDYAILEVLRRNPS
jgi:hypothetical protein